VSQKNKSSYRLVFPWDALVPDNRRFIGGRGRSHVLTQRYRDAKDLMGMLALAQIKGKKPLHPKKRVWMRLEFYMPDKRRRDPNNLLKGIADALEGCVYSDDKQIHQLSWENKGLDREYPRVEIDYGEYNSD
tara:strand:+ start:206 stop:601 length:396 start_codon:yes stop_codon:yes gene_type:complete